MQRRRHRFDQRRAHLRCRRNFSGGGEVPVNARVTIRCRWPGDEDGIQSGAGVGIRHAHAVAVGVYVERSAGTRATGEMHISAGR